MHPRCECGTGVIPRHKLVMGCAEVLARRANGVMWAQKSSVSLPIPSRHLPFLHTSGKDPGAGRGGRRKPGLRGEREPGKENPLTPGC